MFRKRISTFILLATLSAVLTAWSAPGDEVTESLARAEALYYEADFTKSIELLMRVDEMLRPQFGHVQEKASVKMQLALAYIGLNDNVRARDSFRELYEMDPDHAIDPMQFSPKVVTLADQARKEQNDLRCRTVVSDAEQKLGAGEAEAVRQLIGSGLAKCAGLESLAPKTAELLFKEGVDLYKRTRLVDALQRFRSALDLNSSHELARQYAELVESKLQLDSDRVILAWRKDFEARDFTAAAAGYRRLVAVTGAEVVNQVKAEYRNVLSGLVESWNRACAAHDTAAMEKIRTQIADLLPDLSMGADILAKMTDCTSVGCLQMAAPLALARLRNRVDPTFPDDIRTQIKISPVTVRVKAKINEKGDVAGADLEGGNPILYDRVRAAVLRWKFSPAIVQGDARCVDTEIPMVINFVTQGSSSAR